MVASSKLYDLVIVGGGVVGAAVLRAATLEGWNCALIESEEDLLSHASGSNSGIACTGVDAHPDTLERALIRDSNSMFRIYCQKHNIPTRPCGSLVCLWPWDEDDNLAAVLAESHDAGDTHAAKIFPEEVRSLEPNLATSCRGAVHIPGEIVVDPWLYSISLACHARENGADIYTSFAFDSDTSSFDDSHGLWHIIQKPKDASSPPKQLRAKAIVNAAGLWSDLVQQKGLNASSQWNAKPRRGQYRIYSSPQNTITHPIQPIPTQRTKGIFVFSSLYNQIVVGPTALDQESRTDRSIDPKVAEELDAHAKRIIPGLNPENDLIGEYVGVRPGTDQRDYQIHLYPRKNWISVAGIRSTGLTASLGIGNHVVRNLRAILESPEDTPAVKTTPMPPISALVEDFHKRKGSVEINGFEYKVTHPLTKLGWNAREGLANTSGIQSIG